MIAVFRFLSSWPLGLVHALGWLAGWAAFGASGVYRRRFLDNTRQAGLPFAQVRAAVGQAGQLLAELPRLWLGPPVQVEWTGAEHIDNALALGRGVVFLTPHLGCFEVTAQAYAQRYGVNGHPMTVLYRPPRKTWLRDLVATARNRPGLHTAPTTLAGVKQLIKALKRGDTVGLLPDQVPPVGLGQWAAFFGKEAYTMTLPARLAHTSGAAVLLAWGERLAWGQGYKVHVLPALSAIPQNVGAATQTVNHALEALVLTCPRQYLWGYARYKPPRQDAPEAATKAATL
jgi:Kdo2-lipid IVA lauroyltransferase/acyltransferase